MLNEHSHVTFSKHVSLSVGIILARILDYNWDKRDIRRAKMLNPAGKQVTLPPTNMKGHFDLLPSEDSDTRKMPTSTNVCTERRAYQSELAKITESQPMVREGAMPSDSDTARF